MSDEYDNADIQHYDQFLPIWDQLLSDGAARALLIAARYRDDGGHHKVWVIDQMCRALTGDNYGDFVADVRDGDDGPDTYEWDEGIAP